MKNRANFCQFTPPRNEGPINNTLLIYCDADSKCTEPDADSGILFHLQLIMVLSFSISNRSFRINKNN